MGPCNDLASQLQEREQRQSFKSENDSVPSMQDLTQPNTTTPAVPGKKGSLESIWCLLAIAATFQEKCGISRGNLEWTHYIRHSESMEVT
nr:unnamed protein product [Timema tahoe]